MDKIDFDMIALDAGRAEEQALDLVHYLALILEGVAALTS
jgi:hypothetical protein